jgi:hypothetical protein
MHCHYFEQAAISWADWFLNCLLRAPLKVPHLPRARQVSKKSSSRRQLLLPGNTLECRARGKQHLPLRGYCDAGPK